MFDIARAMKGVEAGDKDAWERAWLALAEKTEARAKAALATGRGCEVDGQAEAIHRPCTWLDTLRQDTPAGPWWPAARPAVTGC